jgi:hypothetical protein
LAVVDFALVVDRAPQIHSPAGHLVERPSVARPRPALPQLAGDQRTKLQHPAPHRFVRNVQPALGEKILDIPVAQREAQVEPDRVLDDNRRKAVAAE